MLTVENVSMKYYARKVIESVSFELHPGEIVALLGENGAGKSTLMKGILGYQPLSDGKIRLDGEPITEKNIERISFGTCEHSFFAKLSPKQHLEFYQMQFPKFSEKRFTTLMKFFGLSWGKKLGSFSTGQQNQFEVVLALSQGADYIFLDEPFTGADIFIREDFYKVLLGIIEDHECILLSTHLIEEVQHVISRALLLHKGQILEDVSTDELDESKEGLIQHLYQVYHPNDNRVEDAINSVKEEQ